MYGCQSNVNPVCNSGVGIFACAGLERAGGDGPANRLALLSSAASMAKNIFKRYSALLSEFYLPDRMLFVVRRHGGTAEERQDGFTCGGNTPHFFISWRRRQRQEVLYKDVQALNQ